MKIKLQTLLKHKLQWLLLLAALLGVSQGAWAYDYPANTDVYVKSSTYYNTVKLYAWYNDGSNHDVSDRWCGSVMTYLGKVGSYYYWKIQFNHYFSKMIVCDGSCKKISGEADGEVSSSLAAKNCITITGSSYSWGVFDMCNQFSTPAAVLNGTDVMFYIDENDYGFGMSGANSKTGVVYDNNKCALATRIGSTSYGYVTMSSANVESAIKLTNNWSTWSGQVVENNQTPELARGSLYRGGSNNVGRTAATTVSVVPSSSSIQLGTSSINLSITGTSNNAKSVYNNLDLFALIYVDDTKDGCMAVSTSAQTYELTTSSLSAGDHTIKTILTDGTIYYIGNSFTLTVTSCNAPSVTTTSGASSVTNSGATLKGTVTITSGDCEVTDAGIAYGTSTNPTTPASYGEPTSGEEFEVNISGLSAGERYYYRAYVTAGGVTTYGEEYTFYTNPSELYIKGPLVYDSKWGPYTQDNVGYSHTAGTNTFVFSFNARTGGGGHSDHREFCISTTEGEEGKIQSSMDGTPSGWSFKSESNLNFVASLTIVSTDNTAIDITITYNNSTGQYHMVLAGACSGAPTINNGDIASKNWTKCGNENGRELSIAASGGSGTLTYQWFRNTTNTLTDDVADLTGATAVTDMVEGGNTYSPSASDYGVFYYCCVVRSGGACSANKAISVYTGAIEIKQTPTVKPSTITVKQYEPVKLNATNSSVNWSITTHPEGAADEYYLYDETKNSAMFKGKTGSYTVTATSTGSECTSTSAITVENDPNTCN